MDTYRRYFEENPELFAALVAIMAVLGGLAGSVIGAKIQANGGRDQAAAAREAAKITAEAQRVAALWTVRQVQVAELIRLANSQLQRCERFWFFPELDLDDDSTALSDQIARESEELSLRWAEVRLILTDNAVEAAGKLVLATADVEARVQRYAWLRHARIALASATVANENVAIEVARIFETDAGGRERQMEALRDAVPSLTEEHASHLVAHQGASDQYIEGEKNSARHEFYQALNALVHEARAMLRSEDDRAAA
ncbi:hypothetical protein [Streptomyces microflavus]|uniref:hypothetical protein n=1 Tax=Streptomyces microflavus TaxID=1919 RepID=UPI003865B3BF|nr:hypothetical protein OH770_27740 [Streptomyces microflavus]